MSKVNRDFKGIWISKEIWESRELTIMEKIFYVEIDSLDNDLGCFASNGYFSDFFNVSKQRCSQIVNSLLKKECISIEYEREGKEIIKRTIRVSNKFNRVSNKCEQGIKKSLTGYQENAKGNNTSNNTSNKGKKFIKPAITDIQLYMDEKNINCFTSKYFYDWNEARGWMLGKNKMKDWKATIRTWNQNDKSKKRDNYELL